MSNVEGERQMAAKPDEAQQKSDASIQLAMELAAELNALLAEPELKVEWKAQVLLATANAVNFLLDRYVTES